MATNIALDPDTNITHFIGEIVKVVGIVKDNPVTMVGVLSGVTHTPTNTMVYMEFGQTTTFSPEGLRIHQD